MGIEPDRKAIADAVGRMTRAELLEELALRAEDWTPQARPVLEAAAAARGITAAEIARRRDAEAPREEEPGIDFPALLLSCEEKESAGALAQELRGRGVPALVREMDARSCGPGGLAVGRWGLIVPGARVGEASRILGALVDLPEGGCGARACASCGGAAAEEREPLPEFTEEGDWWKPGPGVPLEGDERDR
jgi:hypothetical protein